MEVHPPLGLSGVLATSARLFGATYKHVLPVFVLFATVLSVMPAIFLVDLSDGLILPLYLIIQVVLPAFLASIAFGIAAVVFDQAEISAEVYENPVRRAGREVKRNAKDVITAALSAGMICLALATFFGPIGLLILGTFFGPPILMQAICLEEVSLQEGWARTRLLLKGHALRVFGYLLTIALGIGLSGALVVSTVGGAIAESPGRSIAFALIQIVVLSATLPFLAAAQYACYRDLKYRKEV